MALAATPNNVYVQSANQQILVSWDQAPGATSYSIQRSQDNITFITLATVSGSPLATQYLDITPALSTVYFYQVASVNSSGTSSYSTPQSAIATPTGEMSLAGIRLAAQQRADRVNSQFVSNPEWRSYINQAMFELYDLLVTTYEDYFLAPPAMFVSNGSLMNYNLPDGTTSFLVPNSNTSFIPQPMYKLRGVDLALNTYPNAYVTLDRYNYADRNQYVFPNSGSSLYGVFNPKYRVMGNQINFIPTPSAGQQIVLHYIPRLTELLADTDTTTQGISGWIEYVIVRAAKYALDKEEADTTKFDQQLLFLKQRIEAAAENRDSGSPETIANVNRGPWGTGFGGPGGMQGGF